MSDRLQWASALSTRPSLEAAIAEACERVRQQVSAPEVGFLFVSSGYASEYERVVPLLREYLPLPALVGCGGGGIVGTDANRSAIEVEGGPALSLSVASLGDGAAVPFQVAVEALPDLDAPATAWTDLTGVPVERDPDFVLLADPRFAKVNDLLEGLDFAYPGAAKVGGLESGLMAGQGGLFYHSDATPEASGLFRGGVVGIALCGNLRLDTIVAQGCRPVGSTLQVVEGDRNIIVSVTTADAPDNPVPPLEALRRILGELSDADRELAQHSLFVGVARDAFKFELEQGDFLIRNLIGVDPQAGAIAVGDRVRPGQRLQFHLRDANTSAEDLELLLQAYRRDLGDGSAAGGLLFSCLGRGRELYGKPNFDSGLFQQYFAGVSLGGFFCNGEIGPVGDRTFLHGYTSSFGILRAT